MAESTQTQITRLAPFQEEMLADIYQTGKDLTGPDSQMPYSAEELAGLSEAQKLAITKGTEGIGGYAPYMTEGGDSITSGIGSVGTGMETVEGALDNIPEAEQGYRDQQTAMLEAQALGQTGTEQAQAMTAGANYGFDPTSYQSYMNPYMDDIVQQSYQDIQRAGDIQKNQIDAQSVGAGAFGGSRQGIERAETNRNIMDQQARTGSQLRSSGFQQASNLAQQAAANQAQQQLSQANLYGQQAGQLGLQGMQGAAGYGQAAAGLGNLSQLQGQLGQTQGQLGQTQGQLGQAYAGLGQMGQQMGVQDINTLMGIGALGQGQAQGQLDVTRRNDLAMQSLPYQQVGFMSDIFRGVPALQQTYSTSTAPPPSTQSQLYGLGIAGIGAYGMANRGKTD